MAKKINLDMTSVENREMRLGTIITLLERIYSAAVGGK